jgi:glycerol-3-phosphate O-acyltransferase
MEKNSMSNLSFEKALAASIHNGIIPRKYGEILGQFYHSYRKTLEQHHLPIAELQQPFLTFLKLVEEHCANPFIFEPYHEQIRTPFDYYTFGLDFLRPLVDKKNSSVHGLKNLAEIATHLKTGHNVILLANHQIEGDPQAISLLLEDAYPQIAEKMIFVAGERVITDPLAVPFSMGRNLLCIYSKRYIDNPPEEKTKKQLHNKKTMELMSALLGEGGKCIYVAPSGGRDRRNEKGVVEVAPFDPQSIEMFYLMAKRASHPTFFYPMALKTYDLLPPPETIQVELGEVRSTNRGAIHLAVGKVIDMEHFPGSATSDKHEKRRIRAEFIQNQVKKDYTELE